MGMERHWHRALRGGGDLDVLGGWLAWNTWVLWILRVLWSLRDFWVPFRWLSILIVLPKHAYTGPLVEYLIQVDIGVWPPQLHAP